MTSGPHTRPSTEPSGELVQTLMQRATLLQTLRDPNVTLARAAATYLMFKRRRLTEASERGYRAALNDFTSRHPKARLSEFEPPEGTIAVEDYLIQRYGHLNGHTYNKALAVLTDMFSWHVARGTILRNPVATIERAKARPILRVTFTDAQVARIFEANREPHDQIALRLLLHYGIRKGALRGVRFENFDTEKRRLTIVTKGGKIHTLPLVEERIWQLLDELDAPCHLERCTLQRSPPAPLLERQQQLGDFAETIAAVSDFSCAEERALLLEHIEASFALLSLMVEAASFQIVDRDPEKPRGEHGTHLWWYRCLARAGIVERGTTAGRRMHGARHTSIQRVLDGTGNLKAAQVLAGHAGVGTTGDIYSGWEIGQLEETMREVLA